MNKTVRLLEPRGNSVPPERTDAETAKAPVTNDGPAHTQMRGKSVAEPQARASSCKALPLPSPDGFHLIQPQLQVAFLAASLSPHRVLHATQRTLQHPGLPVFTMACCLHMYLVTQVFNFTLCVWVLRQHVFLCTMCMPCPWRPEESMGSPWDWGHRQL